MISELYMSIRGVFLFMCLVFIIASIIKDNSIVDIAWGLGFIIIALTTGFATNTAHLIMSILITLWGLRLAGFISMRKLLSHKGEDSRYNAWRQKWKYFYTRSFFQIFMLQGTLMIIFSTPIFLVTNKTVQYPLFIWMGSTIWLIGFYFEAVADFQKYVFKKEHPKKLMTKGLWKYSRHPNYFGESMMWFGIATISLSVPYGIFAFIAPGLLTFFLLKVSGVPMLERKYTGHDWDEYKRKTSVFIPKKPKI